MRIPLGESVEVTVGVELGRTFVCTHCSYRSAVRVRGESWGKGVSPLLLDAEGATERARAEAERFALSDAEENMRLVPCPRCGQRAEGVAPRFWGLWGFAISLPMILGIPIAGGFAALFYGRWHAAGVAAVMLFGSAWIAVTAYKKWSAAATKIVFEEPVRPAR